MYTSIQSHMHHVIHVISFNLMVYYFPQNTKFLLVYMVTEKYI